MYGQLRRRPYEYTHTVQTYMSSRTVLVNVYTISFDFVTDILKPSCSAYSNFARLPILVLLLYNI